MTLKKYSGKAICPLCQGTNVRMLRKGNKGTHVMQCMDCEQIFEGHKLKHVDRRGSGERDDDDPRSQR